MMNSEFLPEFRRKTEEHWRQHSIDPSIYGFQFQAGTRWNAGLSDEQILAYENAVSIRFPLDFKAFLRIMNGTDLPTLNVFGGSGEPFREWIGVYSFPRDIAHVQLRISEVSANREKLAATLADQGFILAVTATLMPIYAHRVVVCDEDPKSSVVLSIWDSEDAVVYGNSLQEYLEVEFLKKHRD
jgi:hypothetical protein